MRRSLVKRWIIGASVAVCAALVGCSVAMKLTYNQGPTLTYWWMDGYANFDDTQKPRVHALIDQWFQWNRAEQLPTVAALLQRLQTQVTEPEITPQAMCGAAADGRQLAKTAFEQAVPAMSEIALTLSPEQLKHIEARFDKNDKKFRDDFLQDRREDRVKAETQRVQERFESIYGSLDDAQRDKLAQLSAASPYDGEQWLAERRAIRREMMQALQSLQAARAGGTAPAQLTAQAQSALRQLEDHVDQSPRLAYRAQEQRVWDYNCGLASQMHATMSASQRQAAKNKMKGWEADLRALSSSRAPVVAAPISR